MYGDIPVSKPTSTISNKIFGEKLLKAEPPAPYLVINQGKVSVPKPERKPSPPKVIVKKKRHPAEEKSLSIERPAEHSAKYVADSIVNKHGKVLDEAKVVQVAISDENMGGMNGTSKNKLNKMRDFNRLAQN